MPRTNRPEPIPPAHLAAFRARLKIGAEAPTLTFDNGSVVTVIRKLEVVGWLGPISRFHVDGDPQDVGGEVERAYRMALAGKVPAEIRHMGGDPTMFGADAPF